MMGTAQILWAEQSLRDARQRWYERRISIYFMANIAGAQECNNEDEEGRSDIESDREDQAAIPQLKSFKEVIASIEQVYNTFWNAMELV